MDNSIILKLMDKAQSNILIINANSIIYQMKKLTISKIFIKLQLFIKVNILMDIVMEEVNSIGMIKNIIKENTNMDSIMEKENFIAQIMVIIKEIGNKENVMDMENGSQQDKIIKLIKEIILMIYSMDMANILGPMDILTKEFGSIIQRNLFIIQPKIVKINQIKGIINY